MIAKFGLILLMLLFGALLFVLGILVPESVRAPVVGLTQSLNAVAVRAPAKKKQPAVVMPKPKETPQPESIPDRDLLIPSPLPLDGVYALQVGRFAASAEADSLVNRAQAAGIAAAAIAVERSGERWVVVAAGRYGKPDEARAARLPVSRTLGLTKGMPVILLPATPAAAATAPVSP